MKFVDYREKLGIGVNDNQKFSMFKNKISVLFSIMEQTSQVMGYEMLFLSYYSEIGETAKSWRRTGMENVCSSIISAETMNEAICKAVVFSNCLTAMGPSPHKTIFKNGINKALSDLKIPFEIFQDDDGDFIFPKGAEEMDAALVSQPLSWLSQYPKAHTAYVKALKEYSEATPDNASDIADKFRKTLETFFQEFFGCDKSLENCKALYGKYLKEKNVPPEIACNLETLLQAYTNFMNGYAKHHDRTGLNVLEYIMYQTGNIIRLLLTIK